jgi:DNA-directed RNA polymerase subunit RPC12/RpoP
MQPDPKRPCPYCGSSELFRSHRRGVIERYLFPVVGVRPVRCGNCDARFYRLKHSDGSQSQNIKAA